MILVLTCPKTGELLQGPLTQEQIHGYLFQPVRHPSFRKPVVIDGTRIDEWTGPGLWYGGAGF